MSWGSQLRVCVLFGLQITMTLTMNSSSKTSPMQIRPLHRRPAASAHYRSPWGRLAHPFLAILSSCLWAAVPSRRGSRQTLHLPFLRRSAGVQPPRPRTAQAAGCPMSDTPHSMPTSQRMPYRTQSQSSLCPTRPLLLSFPFSRELPQPLLNLWVISVLRSQRVTQRSHLLYQRRKTNTVSSLHTL